MLELFQNLAGDLSSYNEDLVLVLSAVFFLFLLTEFSFILRQTIDFIFRRR